MDEKEETSKGMCEPRRVSARVAAGSLAAGGRTVDQFPREDRENVAKRVVKQAVRRLLPFVGAHGNSLGLGPPEAGSRNAASTTLYGSSTSRTEGPAGGAPANEVSYSDQQQQDAQNPPKQGFLSKMLALFRGPGLPACASETATAVPVSTFERAHVEPPTTSRPRSSEHPQGSHFISLPAVLDGSQAGLPHAPRPVKRPATCLRDPPASGAAHLWQQPTVMPTHDPAPSWQFLVSPTQSGTSSQDGAPPLQQEMIIEDVEMEDLSDVIGESLSQQVPLTNFKGTYVVTDTNIFLGSLDLIKRIVWPDTGNEDMVLCIPWMAIQELDNIKNRKKGPLSNSAKCAVTFIYEVLSSKNPRLRGQTVVEARRIDEILRKDGSNINDDHFLHCCLEIRKQGSKVLLMSNDRNLRNKAMINGIETVSADEMAKKLDPPVVKRDCRRTSPSASSTKQEKPSLLLSKDSEFTFGAWQKQKEAAKETSAESNIPTCSVPSRVPDEGTILMEVCEILRRSLDLVLQSELESAFGALWLHVIKFKPPWTAETALQCILRHWIALTGTAFKKSMKPVISNLLSKLSSNCGAGECASTAELAMQLCSELQLHYPQLAGDVARLKQLSESQQASPGSSAAQLDGD